MRLDQGVGRQASPAQQPPELERGLARRSSLRAGRTRRDPGLRYPSPHKGAPCRRSAPRPRLIGKVAGPPCRIRSGLARIARANKAKSRRRGSGTALNVTRVWPMLRKHLTDGLSVLNAVIGAPSTPRRFACLLQEPVADQHTQIGKPDRMTGLLFEFLQHPGARELPSVGFATLRYDEGGFQNGEPLGTFGGKSGYGPEHLLFVHTLSILKHHGDGCQNTTVDWQLQNKAPWLRLRGRATGTGAEPAGSSLRCQSGHSRAAPARSAARNVAQRSPRSFARCPGCRRRALRS